MLTCLVVHTHTGLGFFLVEFATLYQHSVRRHQLCDTVQHGHGTLARAFTWNSRRCRLVAATGVAFTDGR